MASCIREVREHDPLVCAKEAARNLGYSALKEEQGKVIVEFMNGRDVFVILPTGYGKSLCFACLPGAFDLFKGTTGSIVVVVTPLIAIMEDMVQVFSSKGLRAAHLSKDMIDDEVRKGVIDGEYQLVFFSPEALLSQKWRKLLLTPHYQAKLAAFVVDEAHTVYKW